MDYGLLPGIIMNQGFLLYLCSGLMGSYAYILRRSAFGYRLFAFACGFCELGSMTGPSLPEDPNTVPV